MGIFESDITFFVLKFLNIMILTLFIYISVPFFYCVIFIDWIYQYYIKDPFHWDLDKTSC